MQSSSSSSAAARRRRRRLAGAGAADGSVLSPQVREALERIWYVLQYALGFLVCGVSVAVVVQGLVQKAGREDPGVGALRWIALVLLLVVVGYLEGFHITMVTLEKADMRPEGDADAAGATSPSSSSSSTAGADAAGTSSRGAAGNTERAFECWKMIARRTEKFLVGRQLLVTACVYSISLITAVDNYEPWSGFLPQSLLRFMARTGLAGSIMVLSLGQLLPQLIAASYPVHHNNLWGAKLLVALSFLVEDIGLGHVGWLLSEMTKRVARLPKDPFGIATGVIFKGTHLSDHGQEADALVGGDGHGHDHDDGGTDSGGDAGPGGAQGAVSGHGGLDQSGSGGLRSRGGGRDQDGEHDTATYQHQDGGEGGGGGAVSGRGTPLLLKAPPRPNAVPDSTVLEKIVMRRRRHRPAAELAIPAHARRDDEGLQPEDFAEDDEEAAVVVRHGTLTQARSTGGQEHKDNDAGAGESKDGGVDADDAEESLIPTTQLGLELIRCFLSLGILTAALIGMFITIFEKSAFLVLPVAPALLLIMLLFTCMAYLEGMNVAALALEKVPTAVLQSATPAATITHAAIAAEDTVHGDSNSLRRFLVGRQFLVVFSVFVVERMTQHFGLYPLVVLSQVYPQLLAVTNPMYFMGRVGSFVVVQLAMAVERTGVGHGGWLLAKLALWTSEHFAWLDPLAEDFAIGKNVGIARVTAQPVLVHSSSASDTMSAQDDPQEPAS